MTEGQRRRLDEVVNDYRDADIPDAAIAGAVHRLAADFTPPAAPLDVEDYLESKGI